MRIVFVFLSASGWSAAASGEDRVLRYPAGRRSGCILFVLAAWPGRSRYSVQRSSVKSGLAAILAVTVVRIEVVNLIMGSIHLQGDGSRQLHQAAALSS